MAITKAKGHEFDTVLVKDSFTRRAVQFKNNVINTLKKIGLTEDDVDIPLEPCMFKKNPASATWYFQGHHLYYRYDSDNKFVDNLYVVAKVIGLEVDAVINERKPIQDFISTFSEDPDVEQQRKKSRTILGLDTDTKDVHLINQRYKELAREHHPDTPTGNLEKFKEINHAHKILKREFE